MNFDEWWDAPNGAAGVRRSPDRPHDEEIAWAAFGAGRTHQRDIDARLYSEPGFYTKLADEMKAERIADDLKAGESTTEASG